MMKKVADRLASMSTLAQIGFWARVMYELTLVGRGCYSVQSGQKYCENRMHCVNERQHRISAHMMHLSDGSGGTYPLDVLIGFILEPVPDDRVGTAEFALAFQDAVRNLDKESR